MKSKENTITNLSCSPVHPAKNIFLAAFFETLLNRWLLKRRWEIFCNPQKLVCSLMNCCLIKPTISNSILLFLPDIRFLTLGLIGFTRSANNAFLTVELSTLLGESKFSSSLQRTKKPSRGWGTSLHANHWRLFWFRSSLWLVAAWDSFAWISSSPTLSFLLSPTANLEKTRMILRNFFQFLRRAKNKSSWYPRTAKVFWVKNVWETSLWSTELLRTSVVTMIFV